MGRKLWPCFRDCDGHDHRQDKDLRRYSQEEHVMIAIGGVSTTKTASRRCRTNSRKERQRREKEIALSEISKRPNSFYVGSFTHLPEPTHLTKCCSSKKQVDRTVSSTDATAMFRLI